MTSPRHYILHRTVVHDGDAVESFKGAGGAWWFDDCRIHTQELLDYTESPAGEAVLVVWWLEPVYS